MGRHRHARGFDLAESQVGPFLLGARRTRFGIAVEKYVAAV